ncbi:MAG: ABC transporter permease subunit [Bacilli bacterium]|nr:ABC transporter permease subunit [Bacilli bacterium]
MINTVLINLWKGALETTAMTIIATILAYLVGLPLGVLLNITGKNGIKRNKLINIPLGIIVNVLRSIPCILLIIILLPLTRSIFGRGTGEWYTMIVPLFIASFAFVSRMVESSLNEVDNGVIEMAKSVGASTWQIITKVLIKESLPSLITGLAVSTISILGYTAFAYDFGAGGLIAEAYSFYASHTATYLKYPNIWIIILIIVLIVQGIQELGLLIAKKIDKRRKN